MQLKPTKSSLAEFEFCLGSKLDMIGHCVGVDVIASPDGFSAEQCWFARDTHGQVLPCREPDRLAKAIRSKQSINLQVKLWAEDLADGMLLTRAELEQYTRGWPQWVFRAVVEQAARIAKRTIGFVPRFIKP